MMRDEDLARRLVVRRGAGGNCTYDESAKRELIDVCLRGGHSVAQVARTYGLNLKTAVSRFQEHQLLKEQAILVGR